MRIDGRARVAAAVPLVALACGIVAGFVTTGWWSILAYEGAGFGAAALVVAATIRYRPTPRRPWLLFAVGIACSATGDLLWDITTQVRHLPGYTSWLANVAYLLAYPCFAAGALGLLGHRAARRDVLVLLEAVALAAAGWLVLWVQIVHPQLADGALGFWDWLPTVLYPPLDLVVIVMVWRLGRGHLRRFAPWRFLIAGFLVMFVADWLYAMVGVTGSDTVNEVLNLGWILAYGCIAAAAVHPDMVHLKGDPELVNPVPSRARVLGMTIACLVPFVLLLTAPARVSAVSVVVACTGMLIVVAVGLRTHLLAESGRTAVEQLAYRATRDPLTGLANRAALVDHLVLASRRALRTHRGCAVAFLDLDDFKAVNDSLGHARGDELLRIVADRLRSIARANECVARLGGDEFVLVFEDLEQEVDALAAAERIVTALNEPVVVGDVDVAPRASVGLVTNAQLHGDDVEAVLRDADLAMYEAKASGPGRVVVFDSVMRTRAVELLAAKSALARAVERGELRLDYQPIIDGATGHQFGAEALLRWDRDGAVVPPLDFVPLAETSGLIVPIGEWVLERAARDLATSGAGDLVVNVNLSVVQLQRPGFAERAEQIVTTAGVTPARVVLELTESTLLEPDPVVDANLEALEAAGFALAIDDFGTGYSSLAYLRRLRVDWIKIDRAFISDIVRDDGDRVVVRTVIRMARELGIAVVAEGVETGDQLALLRELGCDAVQGWFLGRPGPAMVVATSLRNAVDA